MLGGVRGCKNANRIVLDGDAHDAARTKRPEQQPFGQRLLDDALDQASHRPGAERAVETLARQPRPGGRFELDGDAFTRIAQGIARTDSGRALDMLSQVPSAQRPDWLSGVAQQLAQSDPDSAVALIGQYRGQPEYAAAYTEHLNNIIHYWWFDEEKAARTEANEKANRPNYPDRPDHQMEGIDRRWWIGHAEPMPEDGGR